MESPGLLTRTRHEAAPSESSTASAPQGMELTAARLVASGKGILAADESIPTLEKRFRALDIPCTPGARKAYRWLLVGTPGLSAFVSGVILFDETLREKNPDGVPLPELLTQRGILPGIKVDLGLLDMPNFPGATLTKGLDKLRERLAEYRALGARFTKWRAVIRVGEEQSSLPVIQTNASILAQFAAMSQEAGLVPMVEPEVLMEGNHSLADCEQTTQSTLMQVFQALSEHRVVLEEMILKTGMILPGSGSPDRANADVVSAHTVRCLRRVVPSAVPGIVFLSGGQTADTATHHLNAICRKETLPWRLSFSFGRALQSAAMQVWKGADANTTAAQAALLLHAGRNSLAVQGRWCAGGGL